MRNLFSLESPICRLLSKVADLVSLNLMFIICSIPIVTIGASLTTLYSITSKIASNQEVYIFKSFIKEFKSNFKQGTIIWVIMVIIGIVIFLDFEIINILPYSVYKFMKVILIIISVFYTLILFYIFAYISKFKASVILSFKNALLISILNLPYTLFIIVFTIGMSSIVLFNPTTFIWGLNIWILIGFSLIALVNSYSFNRIFKRYE